MITEITLQNNSTSFKRFLLFDPNCKNQKSRIPGLNYEDICQVLKFQKHHVSEVYIQVHKTPEMPTVFNNIFLNIESFKIDGSKHTQPVFLTGDPFSSQSDVIALHKFFSIGLGNKIHISLPKKTHISLTFYENPFGEILKYECPLVHRSIEKYQILKHRINHLLSVHKIDRSHIITYRDQFLSIKNRIKNIQFSLNILEGIVACYCDLTDLLARVDKTLNTVPNPVMKEMQSPKFKKTKINKKPALKPIAQPLKKLKPRNNFFSLHLHNKTKNMAKKSTTRGLGKKTKCSAAGSQLATKSTAKVTKVKAAKKLGKC